MLIPIKIERKDRSYDHYFELTQPILEKYDEEKYTVYLEEFIYREYPILCWQKHLSSEQFLRFIKQRKNFIYFLNVLISYRNRILFAEKEVHEFLEKQVEKYKSDKFVLMKIRRAQKALLYYKKPISLAKIRKVEDIHRRWLFKLKQLKFEDSPQFFDLVLAALLIIAAIIVVLFA